MSIVLSSAQIKAGKTGSVRSAGGFVQPLQFIPREEKNDDWIYNNLDFLEYQGLQQIFRKAPHFSKNYNLAAGIIDKSDYGINSNSEDKELLENLMTPGEETSMDLEFYPIIPTVVTVLTTEFAKRNTKVMFMATDEYSYNELLELKKEEISQVLLKEAEQKLLQQLIESGKDPSDPEDQQLFQQQLSPENLKTLPEIEEFYNKTYRSMIEEWAVHTHHDDVARFGMDELELRNFRNSLITDSAYFHFLMKENDYEIEVWNPMFTYVFKSPETRYTSLAYAAGNVQIMTIADAIDKYGYIMTEEQLRSLESIYPQTNALAPVTGYDPTSYYDNTKSHAENVNGPSMGMRQLASVVGEVGGSDMLTRLMSYNQYGGMNRQYLLRVTTSYWKSQRKVGHLTQVKSNGEIVIKIVDESHVITDHPVYNNTLIDNRNPQTLIFGEHIDWIWINQTWGGLKIGPNIPSYATMPSSTTASGLQPIYLGIDQNKVGPLKYQFKGDNNLYGCKLPVEGATFSDYNTRSNCLVDLLKPFQIGYNVANNQIKDIIMDELGTVIAIDPNQLPQKSLGEDWGKGNYAKAYTAMRNFNILPLDRTLSNTESSTSSNASVQVMNLEQSARLQSRINLAIYYKNEGLGLLGITPQRLGQPEGRQTATGVEENLKASYAQTEQYYIQFSDWLMPRVHQMRTDLAQYYCSTNPSIRLQYLTSKDERVNFQINGTNLLLRDLNLHWTSTANIRMVVEEFRKLLITNNTAGGTIYELGSLLTADSLGEMNNIIKKIEKRADVKRREDQEHEIALQKQKDEDALQARKLELDNIAREAEKNRRKDIMVAEIRAAGYSGSVDLNNNQQNDFLDNLKVIQGQNQFQESMNFEREKELNKSTLQRDKSNLEKEKMNTQIKSKQIELEIARTNKNSSDLKKHHEKKKREAEKKSKK